MKGAAEYAKRLKRFLAPLKKQRRKAEPGRPAPANREVIEELVLAILEELTDRASARAALEALRRWVVDYNDLRVTSPRELLRIMNQSLPQAREKAQRISQVLSHIFEKKNSLNINSLRDLPIREVRQFLNLLDGMTPFVSATVVRRCLGGHAIPMDEVLEKFLKDQELAPADADPTELQGFLERHVLAVDSYLFLTVVRTRALGHYRRAQARQAREAATKKAASSGAKTKKTGGKTPASRTGRAARKMKSARSSRRAAKTKSRKPTTRSSRSSR